VGKSRHEEETAATHFYASCSRPQTGSELCESQDDAEAIAMEELAELIVRRSGGAVDRRTALQMGAAIFEVQRAKDAKCAGGAPMYVGGVDGAINAASAWMLQPDAADKLEQALSRAREARDSKLALGCLAFARGKPPYGVWSMRDLAKLHGVSVTAVSNEVSEFQDILGLPRTTQQKSDRAVRVYARTNGARVRETMEAK
jgi:hypothetical protein